MYGDLVSVIIPTYNRIRTIARAIDSVRNQTYNHLEVIVVDDGSTDGTFEHIQKRFSNADWLTYVVNEHNLGCAASRNIGAQYARGKYIAFQDSDDEWLPQKLEKQMQLFDRCDAHTGMVYCCIERFWIEGGEHRIWPPRYVPYEMKSGNVFDFLLLYPLISTQDILVKKDCFFEVGAFCDDIRCLVDYEFSIRFAKAYDIALLDEPLVRVFRSENCVSDNFQANVDTQCYIIDKYYNEMTSKGILLKKLDMVWQDAVNRDVAVHFLETLLKYPRAALLQYVKDKMAILK